MGSIADGTNSVTAANEAIDELIADRAAQNARIERALEQITPGANATVSRIGRILRGEQG
jgi:hypothetical protein